MILIEFLKIIFSKNFWTYPQKSKNLIIDSAGADELFASSILRKNETLIVDLDHYRWANFFTLIHAFWKRPGMLFQDKFCFVFLSYIELANARNVITWMDYIISFYRLKNFKEEPQYISIQTGRRSNEPGEFFDSLKKLGDKSLTCDYVFCFGEAHKREYEKYIKCTAIPGGSVRSNLVPIVNLKQKKEILFLSQFRKMKGDVFCTFFEDISYERFYKTEKLLFDRLVPFCKENNLTLNIVSAIKKNESEELEYFKKLANGFQFNFISHESFATGYESVDTYEYIIAIHSTLAYESLGRGKKVILFDARGAICGIPFDTFGWPMSLPPKGKFWTNEINDTEFNRLIEFLTTASNDDWDPELKKELMQYNYLNPMLKELLS